MEKRARRPSASRAGGQIGDGSSLVPRQAVRTLSPREWFQEHDAALKELWLDGLPTAEIAAALGERFGRRISKNAVIGRAHRLGLGKRLKRNQHTVRRSEEEIAAAAERKRAMERERGARRRAARRLASGKPAAAARKPGSPAEAEPFTPRKPGRILALLGWGRM